MFNQARVRTVFVALGASASATIPVGAAGWTFTVLTGTGGIGGVTGLPATFSDSDVNTTANPIICTTAAASSAYVRYCVGVPS